MEQVWTILRVLQWTTGYFQRHGIAQARADAEVLLAHVLGVQRIDLYLHYDQPLTVDELARYRDLVRRRARCEPTQYIVQHQEFWSLELTVNSAVLIPRPETELLVERAIQLLGDTAARVLDVGTGCGAIALALATECPSAAIFASDASVQALQVARHNAHRHHLADRVTLVAMDLFSALATTQPVFDLIISNPPYIDADEFNRLPAAIARYEPRSALWGGSPHGLGVILQIIGTGLAYLKPAGKLLVEIGQGQAERLEETLAGNPHCKHYQFHKDYSGILRVLEIHKTIS